MKILIATPLYPPDDGGPATYSRILEVELPKLGHEVHIVSFGEVRKYPKLLRHIMYASRLLRKIRNVDVVFALDPVSVGLPAVFVALLSGKKFVVKIVGDYAWEQGKQRFGVKENLDKFVETPSNKFLTQVGLLRFVQVFVAKCATRIIVPSYYLKKIITASAWGIDGEKISVIYNAFKADLPKETKVELRREFNLTAPTIISVGRFVPWKGFKVLMDAVADVRSDLQKNNMPSDVVLELAGSGDSREYKTYASERGYDFVHFLGLISHETLMRRIRASDCFALNTEYEGLSHVILEAMALETPVVATRVGGNVELFDAGRQRWLADYNDKAMLRNLIWMALFEKEGAMKDAQANAQFVSEFTVERMVTETSGLLKRML